MSRIRTEARRGLRAFAFGLVAAVLAWPSDPARSAPYADIVVDANTGNVLHATNPDALRHPASLTKIMTLYLLFEQLENGKLKLDSPLKVSEFAAGQSPTKLGLRPGSTIQVEDAIKGIITRSANDASVVVAEAMAGTEAAFAKQMTSKALALGMSRTVYRNASGLPNDEQVTTARDQSILGRAIQERFPRYYKYFSTRSFSFRGQSIGNHNRLLGRVDGVDGIKTGYTHASGFNLVTSVHRGNRYVVAVVLGGSSASSRDARMRDLISEKISLASTKRTGSMLAEAPVAREGRSTAKTEPRPVPRSEEAKTPATVSGFALASAHDVPARFTPSNEPSASRSETARVALGSTDPIRPVLVKTLLVRGPSGSHVAALTPSLVPAVPAPPPLPGAAAPSTRIEPVIELDPPVIERRPTVAARPVEVAQAPVSEPAPTRGGLPNAVNKVAVPKPEPSAEAAVEASASSRKKAAAPARSLEPTKATLPAEPPPAPVATAPAPSTTSASTTKPQSRSGWMIQVGAYPAEQDAKQRLSIVQTKAAKMLGHADPFTETVDKGGTTFFRARFAGLDKDSAEAACKYLKRNEVECVTIRN